MSKLKKCTLLSTENNKLQRWYDEENQEGLLVQNTAVEPTQRSNRRTIMKLMSKTVKL